MKWPDARDTETDRDALAIALRMEAIVTRLLMLLRSEDGLLPIATEPVRIDGLLQELWSPLAGGAAAK